MNSNFISKVNFENDDVTSIADVVSFGHNY